MDTTTTPAAAKKASLVRTIEIQNYRPQDQRGLNIFEAPKEAGVPFTGLKLSFGAAFTQQFQGLRHDNTATPNMSGTVDLNKPIAMSNGFNNATANLYVDGQLAPGIRVALTSYLSSRHHNETWVKDGYLLVDGSPIDMAPLHKLMEVVTLKLGHFEVNYGDAHFRRSDNGNAMYNPFVGNLIIDAFTTEIGGEVYLRKAGFMAMGGITGGEIRGNVTKPADRSVAYLSKLGFDRQLTQDLRVRLTGSNFQQRSAVSNTLYAGDRAGSRYYFVLENANATESGAFRSGMINPNFGDAVYATMFNPFVKFRGLELFGVAEKGKGRSATETTNREMTQYAADAVYRFFDGEKLYVGGRYNTATAELQFGPTTALVTQEVSVDRYAFGGGWFITPTILLKGEWVDQKYNDFPANDIRNGGKFKGFVVEGVVAF